MQFCWIVSNLCDPLYSDMDVFMLCSSLISKLLRRHYDFERLNSMAYEHSTVALRYILFLYGMGLVKSPHILTNIID